MTDNPDDQHNALMDYPCEFTIKTMGLSNIEFDVIVVEIVRRHAPDLSENAVSSKFSKSKKYVSVSITLTAQNKQQMDAIYQDLTDAEPFLISL